MAERSERLSDQPRSSDPMLLCCVCGRLLDQPQRLRCLHSCCQSCLQPSSACAVDDRHVTTMTANPTCPICHEVSSDLTFNGFIDSRVSRSKAMAKSSLCGICADRCNAHKKAETWCTSCRMSFCETCLPYHGSCHKAHGTTRLEDVKSWSEVFPTPSSLCSIHRKQFDFACLSCKACRCADCWPSCAKLQHDIKHVQDAVVASYVEKTKGDIAKLSKILLRKAEVLSQQKQHAPADLDSGLESDLKKLRDVKQQLLTVIDQVCVTVEVRLRDTYDGLRATAETMSCAMQATACKVRQAAGYSQCVISEGSSVELLNEEQTLISRMTSLCSVLDQLKQPLEAGPYVAFDSTLPDQSKLVSLVTSWIGSPRALTDDMCTRKSNPETSSASSSVGIFEVLRKRLEARGSNELNIGVIGASGVGKSSFINTLRRVRLTDSDAAPTDVMQNTAVSTAYCHPQCPKVKLWDLPGVGTPTFPRASYLQSIDFHRYDFFVIICSLRFTEDDVWFARTVQQSNKHFCFVRTKVDDDVRHDREDYAAAHSEEEVLMRIKDYCIAELSKAGFRDPLVFLVCKNPLLFDFPVLEENLLTVLTELR